MKVTMTLGEFRKATAELPDDAEIFLDEGDLQYHEAIMWVGSPLPPVLGHPYAIVLQMGQVWNDERDLDARVDAWLAS